MTENKKAEPSIPDFILVCPDCNYEFKMHYPKEMIPVSVIDALITDFVARAQFDPLHEPIKQYLMNVIIPMLEETKKQAQPSTSISDGTSN